MLILLLLQIAVIAGLVIYGLLMDAHEVHPLKALVEWGHKLRRH